MILTSIESDKEMEGNFSLGSQDLEKNFVWRLVEEVEDRSKRAMIRQTRIEYVRMRRRVLSCVFFRIIYSAGRRRWTLLTLLYSVHAYVSTYRDTCGRHDDTRNFHSSRKLREFICICRSVVDRSPRPCYSTMYSWRFSLSTTIYTHNSETSLL